MLRHLLTGSVGFSFSSEDDGESPEITMSDDLAEMLFSKQPSRCDPALDHVVGTPARNVVRSLLHAALWTLNDVGSAEAFVQRRRELQSLDGEHFRHALA